MRFRAWPWWLLYVTKEGSIHCTNSWLHESHICFSACLLWRPLTLVILWGLNNTGKMLHITKNMGVSAWGLVPATIRYPIRFSPLVPPYTTTTTGLFSLECLVLAFSSDCFSLAFSYWLKSVSTQQCCWLRWKLSLSLRSQLFSSSWEGFQVFSSTVWMDQELFTERVLFQD